jgi:5,10-methylenetetrahydromethanopterin reductase
MADILAFSMLTFPPIGFVEMGDVAQRADELGWDRMYTTESLTDSLTIDMYLATRTQRMSISSGVALIHYRHPLIAAQASTTICEVSGGRFLLGLGVGHSPRNHAMGVGHGKPLADMREYVGTLRKLFSGEVVYPDLPVQMYEDVPLGIKRPTHPLPISVGAVGPKMVELGGEIADGIQLYLTPLARIPAVREGIAVGASRSGRAASDVEVALAIHVLVSDDLEFARDKARSVLTYWAGLPSYNASIAAAGFEAEAATIRSSFLAGDQHGMRAAMSNELLDQFAVVGPPARCREQIAAMRETGVDVPILHIDPVIPGETFAEALFRSLEALAP